MSAEYDVVKRGSEAIYEEWNDRELGSAWSQVRAFHLAVANWLDNVWFNEPVVDEELRRAVAVARAYLGEQVAR